MQILKKSMENVRKGRDIELLRTERRWTCLVSEPNYHTNFHRKYISNRNEKKTEIRMNKPVYLGLSILELSTILMQNQNMLKKQNRILWIKS